MSNIDLLFKLLHGRFPREFQDVFEHYIKLVRDGEDRGHLLIVVYDENSTTEFTIRSEDLQFPFLAFWAIEEVILENTKSVITWDARELEASIHRSFFGWRIVITRRYGHRNRFNIRIEETKTAYVRN